MNFFQVQNLSMAVSENGDEQQGCIRDDCVDAR